MTTLLLALQLLVVLAMIFIGAKVGGIGLGIYGMVGVFLLVFVFGQEPGAIPIDVMLIIVSVITASSALQAAGGLDYMVNQAARFLKKHPSRITFYAPRYFCSASCCFLRLRQPKFFILLDWQWGFLPWCCWHFSRQ